MTYDWLNFPACLHFVSPSTTRHLLYGILIGFVLSAASTTAALDYAERKRKRVEHKFEDAPRPIELRTDEVLHGVTGLIGNTPLVRINSLSDALGVEILGKAEFLNPGGSVKDRVAMRMLDDAEQQGLLYPHTGSRIFEGTSGSTGISLAMIARARGYDATIVMPDDTAEEKVKAVQSYGAEVEKVRPASIVDKKQYTNLARSLAKSFGQVPSATPETQRKHILPTSSSSVLVTTASNALGDGHTVVSVEEEEELRLRPRGFFADQFENRSNFEAHFEGTGPEIWRQVNGKVDAFIAGAGTGGTIAGVGRYLKSMNESVLVALADPEGSGIYNKVKYGVMYDPKEAEGTKRRHQVDTVVEGIGLNRMTQNLALALPIIDTAFRVTDAEAVSMARWVVQHDGLFLGSSSACNLVACVKLVRERGWSNGERVVTLLCDSGSRHYSKFWNDEYLERVGIPRTTQLAEELLAR